MRGKWGCGVLLAALAVAGCGDDTSANNDLSSGEDLSVGPDMATPPTPGTGELTMADVVGTVFLPSGGSVPRTHVLVAVASLPAVAEATDPSSDFGISPAIHGCAIRRYTATNLPAADGDAGDVTFSGFNTAYTVGVNVLNSSRSAGPMPTSSPITCRRDASMRYQCSYGGTAGPDGGEAGTAVDDVIYPPIPFNVRANNPGAGDPIIANVPPSMGGWPFASMTGACISRITWNPQDPNAPGQGGTNMCTATNIAACTTLLEVCEQSPIVPLGVAQIAETVAGGADWPAASDTLGNGGGLDGGTGQLAGPLFVVSVKSGGTDIAGTDPITMGPSLSMADGAINPMQDLTITFSCDPNSVTAGAGCAGSPDLIGLSITTSTSTKGMFRSSTATGAGSCSGLVGTNSSITVKAAQLQALLGGQTGGSWRLSLVRLTAKLKSPAGTHPTLAFTAGMGTFGYTNQ